MSSPSIQKSAKLDRVRERLFAAVDRLEQAVDGRLNAAEPQGDGAVSEELQRLKTENAALREAAGECDAMQAENRALRDTNAEAAKRVEQTIQALSRALDE